jgi:precorrin-6B C5,15-methyltransferase / cobalt-precorrin-6B C5,C15-methyltransferase
VTAPWLHVIGVSEGGLAPDALGPVMRAARIFGPPRLLEMVPTGVDKGRLFAWQAPLRKMLDQVMAARVAPTVILAGGDPNWFGFGATLGTRLDPAEFEIWPAVSSLSLAAARLKWPLQDVATISLHGRPVEMLAPHILPGNRVLALTSNAALARSAAALVVARGYGQSGVSILENLGGPDERITFATAADLHKVDFGNFHVLAISCLADTDALLLPAVPGLPDDAFVHDGQLTKRDVRAVTLARLAPFPGGLLWDVGAGSGAIAIEWMRAARGCRALAIERDPARIENIKTNRVALGVPGLEIIAANAPNGLEGLASPDAIFIGGSADDEALFAACWQALGPGGRMVVNAVTLAARSVLMDRAAAMGGELVEIAVSHLDTIGQRKILRPVLPVTQWAMTKSMKGTPK